MVYWKVQLIDKRYPSKKKYADTIFFLKENAVRFKNAYSKKIKKAYTFKIIEFEGDGLRELRKFRKL